MAKHKITKPVKKKRQNTTASNEINLTFPLLGLVLVFLLFSLTCDYASNGNLEHTKVLIQKYIPHLEISLDDLSKNITNGIEKIEEIVWDEKTGTTESVSERSNPVYSVTDIPPYPGTGSYVCINDNVPYFTESQVYSEPYEYYSELDSLGRCGYAEAKISLELMPIEERGKIGMVKPSGWHTVKYDIIDGLYLYNRCHLIGYQLTGENANEKNLITGTRYLNVVGMLPWENLVTDYIKRTGHTVMYRVTPIYTGDNLVADGVQMEAASVEDPEISFNIFVYNVQPGIGIDYRNGDSWKI